MFANFQSWGKIPCFNDLLYSLHRDGEITEAVSFSERAGTPSDPVAFVKSRDPSSACTSSTEMARSVITAGSACS